MQYTRTSRTCSPWRQYESILEIFEKSLNYTQTCLYEMCNFLFIDKCNTQKPQELIVHENSMKVI